MSSIKFNDGVSINTSGPLRVTRRFDGYYVVGKGTCIPVDSYQEGEEFIRGQNPMHSETVKGEQDEH